jgi:hypothetical protein
VPDAIALARVTGIPAAFDKTWKPEDFEPQA